MIRRFHLYPNDQVEFPFNKTPSEFGDKKFQYKISGAVSEGDVYPTRISIVKGRTESICVICLKKMGKHGRLPPPKRYGVQPYFYVGFVSDSCWIPYWGYEAKICMSCAVKYIGDHDVYPCTVGREFCDEIWNYVVFNESLPEVPYERKTFMAYIEEQFKIIKKERGRGQDEYCSGV